MSKSHGYDFSKMTLGQLAGLGLKVKGESLDARRDVAIKAAEVFTPETTMAFKLAAKSKPAKPKRKAKLLSIAIFLPIRLISEMNASEHWSKYQARNKAQQEELKVEWYRLTRNAKIELPVEVRFTRIGQKRLDPGNLEASFKHVQDAICSCLEVDDGDSRIKFLYSQEATGKREYGVRIEVVSL